ncbi:MAG: SUMF1/EgtB/PvdO family nonheme iron enzyme [Planctomycetota bacterium]
MSTHWFDAARTLSTCLGAASLCVATPAFGDVFNMPAGLTSLEFVTVGNAGNAADSATGFGAVGYEYRIATTEVTNAQYVEFLNAVDPSGANTLDLFSTDVVPSVTGIQLKTANPAGAKYVALSERENTPVNYVSWYDAIRFTNWLHNGQPSSSMSTESGAYDIDGGTPSPSNGADITRDPKARYFIPTEDEWYKAAYHDSSSGLAGVYFLHATGSNLFPISDQPEDSPGAVNYFFDDGVANGINDGYAVSGSTDFPQNTHPLTPVGAYFQAISPYGTLDQAGNLIEWNETITVGEMRGRRGGAWNADSTLLPSTQRSTSDPNSNNGDVGFRVAAIIPPLPGDANGDGVVDLLDFDILAQTYLTSVPPGTGADFNGNGVVELLDFDILAQNFGASSPATVPEPASAALLALAWPLVTRRRRRSPSRGLG